MFLYVNPHGTRHQLFSNFSKISVFSNGKVPNGTYVFSLLQPDNPGKYSLFLELYQEPVSKQRYFRGYFYLDPKNLSFPNIKQDFLFTGLFNASPDYKGPKCCLTHWFVSNTGSDWIPMDLYSGSSAIDNYELLVEQLDTFFFPQQQQQQQQQQQR